MSRTWRILSVALIFVWLFYVSPIGLSLCEGLMTHDLPPFIAPILNSELQAAFLSLLGVPLLALALWLPKRTAKGAIFALTSCAVMLSHLHYFPSYPDLGLLRKRGLIQAARRLDGLNAEIMAYKKQHGSYPTTLGRWANKYRTGMVCYPTLVYARNSPQEYELGARESVGGTRNDVLFFWSSQSYPTDFYDVNVETLEMPNGTWAYTRE